MICSVLLSPSDRSDDVASVGSEPAHARETGARLPTSGELYWTFDELLRMGVLWGNHEGPPSTLYIEMPTANRTESTHPTPY